jgi:DNA-directed RNA polymerase specialized sigma24 family protein
MASNHYVNNKKLYETYVEYSKNLKYCKENGLEQPRIPEYIAFCIKTMAERIITKYNYRQYTWADDMVGEAILIAVTYAHKFNVDRSDNPYGWLTQIIDNSFKKIINKEKKQLNIKDSYLENIGFFGEGAVCKQNGDTRNYQNVSLDTAQSFLNERQNDKNELQKYIKIPPKYRKKIREITDDKIKQMEIAAGFIQDERENIQ